MGGGNLREPFGKDEREQGASIATRELRTPGNRNTLMEGCPNCGLSEQSRKANTQG